MLFQIKLAKMKLANGEIATKEQEQEHKKLLENGMFAFSDLYDTYEDGEVIANQFETYKKTTAADESVVYHAF
jgi:hypothetical protein